MLLSDPEITTTGDIYLDEQTGNYLDVRLKRTKVTNKVVVSAVPPETLRVGRGATGIHDASFVGFEEEMTRSEIRERWPEAAEGVDWSAVGRVTFIQNLTQTPLHVSKLSVQPCC